MWGILNGEFEVCKTFGWLGCGEWRQGRLHSGDTCVRDCSDAQEMPVSLARPCLCHVSLPSVGLLVHLEHGSVSLTSAFPVSLQCPSLVESIQKLLSKGFWKRHFLGFIDLACKKGPREVGMMLKTDNFPHDYQVIVWPRKVNSILFFFSLLRSCPFHSSPWEVEVLRNDVSVGNISELGKSTVVDSVLTLPSPSPPSWLSDLLSMRRKTVSLRVVLWGFLTIQASSMISSVEETQGRKYEFIERTCGIFLCGSMIFLWW